MFLPALCHAAGVRTMTQDVCDRQCLCWDSPGLLARSRPCSPSMRPLLSSCLVLPYGTVCAAHVRSAELQLPSCNPVCPRQPALRGYSEVTVLSQSRRTWHPVFPRAVSGVACSPDAAECLGSVVCHVTRHARCGRLHLSRHNLLSDM